LTITKIGFVSPTPQKYDTCISIVVVNGAGSGKQSTSLISVKNLQPF